jgi:hypothetical protein
MPLGPAIPPPRRHPLISPSSWPRSEGNQSPGVEPAGRASWPNSHRFVKNPPSTIRAVLARLGRLRVVPLDPADWIDRLPASKFRVAGLTWVSWFCRYRTRSGQPGSGRRETHPSASGPAPTPTSPSRGHAFDNTADGTDPGKQSCAPVDQLTGVESGLPRTPHRWRPVSLARGDQQQTLLTGLSGHQHETFPNRPHNWPRFRADRGHSGHHVLPRMPAPSGRTRRHRGALLRGHAAAGDQPPLYLQGRHGRRRPATQLSAPLSVTQRTATGRPRPEL